MSPEFFDGGAAAPDDAGSDAGEDDAGREVTLQVQNVEFEMKLRPGVHAFLREMSTLFCVHLYTMGSREYVQQALHHLDPNHEIFKPDYRYLRPTKKRIIDEVLISN